MEDDKDSCEMLVLIVRRLYPELVTYCAGDGKTGWELFRQHAPQIVITDLSMPEMDGLQLAIMIRSQQPRTKLIALSADLERAVQQRTGHETLVFDHFLAKPFHFKALMAVIDEPGPA
ncbi:response regulator [Geomonas limicola]|uniref:response regulator n=1 Tax=Geomonas limicola TaxID=2740186 RepID=UPI00161B113A|nr:response regulator [Geomonas limicola]